MKRPAKTDLLDQPAAAKKFENVTLRATPAQKLVLDVLSRRRNTSLSATLQDLVNERLQQEIQELRSHALGEPEQVLGEMLHRAWWHPNEMRPHERLIAVYGVMPDLLTYIEVQTIKVLQDLGAISYGVTRFEHFDEGLMEPYNEWRYEYDPFVVNLVWFKASEVAAQERPSVESVAELAAEISAARRLKAGASDRD